MSAIDKHVSVSVDKQTATVSRQGFGVPCILSYHTVFPELYRVFGSLDEMVTAGFTVNDVTYKLAASIFSQSPRPSTIVLARRTTAVVRDVKLTPKAPVLASTAYTVTVNGTAFTYTTDATPTVAEVTAGLEALIDAGTENVNAVDNTTDLDIEKSDTPGGVAAAGVAFYIGFDATQFDFEDNTLTAAANTDLTNLLTTFTDFYGLVTDLWDPVNIAEVAAAVEPASVPLIYSAETQDSDVITSATGDIASTLQTADYERTFLTYADNIDASKAAGWLGKQLPTTPGSTTWKFKTLNGVSATALTTAEVAFADGKSCNTYTTVGGITITAEGVVSSGEFIDVIRFVDWLTARVKENVFRALAINPKIPFTDSGIQAVVAEVEGVLRQGVFNGGLNGDEDLIVTAPLAADVDANDRASRLLPDIEFIATLAGAIHKTTITGKVVA